MQEVLDRAREMCMEEAVFGVYERDPSPDHRLVPCQDVVAVCLESSYGVPKAHCFPFVNVGDRVIVGGHVGKVPKGKYKGLFFERDKAPEDKGNTRLMAAGVTKRLVASSSADTFRDDSEPDSRLFGWVQDLVDHKAQITKTTEFTIPECYICADDVMDVIPGRNIDHAVLRTSQFGTIDGVPRAPRAGLVEKHTKVGLILDGELIRADAGEIEKRAEPMFGPVVISLYPIPKEGERVKEGQALFTPFPMSPQIQTRPEVDKLPNARVLRWLVLQDSLLQHDGMTLAPLSCISPESSVGEKFVDIQCTRRTRVSMAFNPRTDPIWIKGGGGTEVNFRFTWHRNFILGSDRAAKRVR